MTSTIALRWTLNSSESLQKYEKSISSFKEKARPIVRIMAPEYLDLLDHMHPQMVNVLKDTLKHWKNQPYIPTQMRRRFIESKLIECLAFWKGYLDSGGEFPLMNINDDDTLTHEGSNNMGKEHLYYDKIVAIIPIGDMSIPIQRILTQTLNTLNNHEGIKSIFCVFDGYHSGDQLELEERFNKVCILETPSKYGPAKARNIGVDEAIKYGMSDALFLDSDITLNYEALDNLLQSYKKSNFGVLCPVVKADGDQWLDLYHDFSGTLNGRYLIETNMERLLFGTTSCMIVPGKIFENGFRFSGDFTMAAGEDIDFCLQLYRNGYSIYPMDDISVTHWYGNVNDQNDNWDRFKSRFYRYGVGESHILKRNPNYYTLLDKTIERISI